MPEVLYVAVMWNRIGSDPARDRHPGHADPDPADPDRYQFQAEVFKILKIYFVPASELE
jgi:hypothetical protein